jgi:hypothetical protein
VTGAVVKQIVGVSTMPIEVMNEPEAVPTSRAAPVGGSRRTARRGP